VRKRRREPARIFVLSPANCGGVRANMVASPTAQFELARQLRSRQGAPLGEVFSFVSGLYFRGKLAYARRFARPPDPDEPVVGGGVLVITPSAGLRSPDTRVTIASFTDFAHVPIAVDNASYREPLVRSAKALDRAAGPDCEVVLLGSIASGKYGELLLPIFGERLLFPPDFIGRGDVSRGGLMLRCVTAGLELPYTPLKGATRHGARPPRLAPLRKT
jgi:hypothetical protein